MILYLKAVTDSLPRGVNFDFISSILSLVVKVRADIYYFDRLLVDEFIERSYLRLFTGENIAFFLSVSIN